MSSHPVDASWALVAPVFDRRHARQGLWLELCCAADEAEVVANRLLEQLQRGPPTAWLFVRDVADTLTPYLPLAVAGESVLVQPVCETAQGKLPLGLERALQGCRAQLASDQTAAWHVVTDAAGSVDDPPGSAQALADGLSGWPDCQPLVDRGWQAFMMTGNQRLDQKRQPKADQIALTRLLSLVAKDAEIDELEALFKAQPKLAFDLLNLVNSPALSLRTPATNFRHAITLLGRRQLQRWLQLLMFTRQTHQSGINILLWHSAFRGRFMERLAIQLDWSIEVADQAFMIGVFSLLDVLLDERLDKLLTPLSLPEDVLNTLLKHEGPLGDLLRLAKAIERRDQAAVSALSQIFHSDACTLLDLQLESLFWVESLSSPTTP